MTVIRSIVSRARAAAPRRVLVPALLAGVAMLGATSVLSAQTVMTRQPPQISVTAQGSVDVTPDRARVVLGVETEAKTAQEAAQTNAAAQTRVIDALRRLGIAATNIRTTGYNVAPKQEYLPEERRWRVDGYQVSNLVVVTLEPVSKAGEVIDAALAAGANRVASLSFEVKDPTAAREQAIEAAVSQARREATLAAKAAGGELVGLLDLTVNSFEATPRPMMEMMAVRADASSTPISEGTQQVVVSVSTQWEFRRVTPPER